MPDVKVEERKFFKKNMDLVDSTVSKYFKVGSRDFGVEQEPGDPDKKVKFEAMEKGIKAVLDLGFVLPEELKLVTSATENIPCVAIMGTAAEPEFVLILGPKATQINKAATGAPATLRGGLGEKTKGPRGVANMAYDKHKKPLDQVTAIVIHELGHILHCTMNPGRFWQQKNNPENVQAKILAPRISHYATNNSLEYVAEFFVSVVLGITEGFDDELIQQYDQLGGPSTSKFKRLSGPS